jgi:coenzyme Q-binding protein COQ10
MRAKILPSCRLRDSANRITAEIMHSHAERRPLPFAPEVVFDLVADVDRYPEFLPWCVATRVRRKAEDGFEADMTIGFKVFRESFTSRVKIERPHQIDVTYKYGPFKYLTNCWIFEPAGEGACVVDFHVEFEFRSHMLERLIGTVFTEAVHRMVAAFESRAYQLYGRRASDKKGAKRPK